ncbi:MAG: hypothetical protein M1835_001315 [Candelina submexicana]|nr:MAG: hypothetical protein M1835_001315 [Candelina submexicana]
MWFLKVFDDLQLDIVGFLAILGEGSVARNAQVTTLSSFALIPRLSPAPQAFYLHERPSRLPMKQGTVIGVYSGNVRYELNFFSNLLHTDTLQRFEVKIVRLSLSTPEGDSRAINAYPFGPLFWLAIMGAVMSFALIVLSVVWNDGMSLLATILLSLISTVIGIGSRWTLDLPEPRGDRRTVPNGDVVIYYPHGSFLIVRCEEAVARMYFTAESCNYYWNDNAYRTTALFASLMLMGGIVMLSNSTIKLQICWLGAYALLNAAYWAVAALNPARHNWDTTAFEIEHEGYEGEETPPTNYTEALWRAIAITRTTEWVKAATGIAPSSQNWVHFLREAEDAAQSRPLEFSQNRKLILPHWDAQKALTDVMLGKTGNVLV